MRYFLLWLLLTTTVKAQDEEWFGRPFMPKINALPLDVNGNLHIGEMPMPLRVKAVDGDWLDVGGFRFRKSEVIPLETSEPYFTEIVRINPQSARCYVSRAIVRKFLGKHDEAIEDYSTAIRLDPTRASHYYNRGLLWHYSKRNQEAALKDYNESIRLGPLVALRFLARAELLRVKDDFGAALADYDKAIRLDPSLASAFNGRGLTWKSKGNLDAAIRDYEEAVRLDQKFSTGYSNLAWILATSPDPKFRDGKRAVLAATIACELSSWKEVAPVRALAAAYAETGDFNSAIQEQTKALELISEKNKPAEQSRLKYYQTGKPYRDKPTKSSK